MQNVGFLITRLISYLQTYTKYLISYILYIMQCIRHMNSNITYLQDYYINILDILYLFIRYIIYMSAVTQKGGLT